MFSQKPGRFEKENQNQDREGDGITKARGNITGDEGFGDADDEAAESGAGEIADSAENSGDEGFKSGENPHEWIDAGIDGGIEKGGGGGQTGAEDEGEADYGIDIDTHQAGDAVVEGDGAHGGAHFGVVDDETEKHHESESGDDDDDGIGSNDLPRELVHQVVFLVQALCRGQEANTIGPRAISYFC